MSRLRSWRPAKVPAASRFRSASLPRRLRIGRDVAVARRLRRHQISAIVSHHPIGPGEVENALGKVFVALHARHGAGPLESLLGSLGRLGAGATVFDGTGEAGIAGRCRAAGSDLVVLDAPGGRAAAWRRAGELARQRDCEFLLVAKDGVRLVTDAPRQMLVAMLEDPRLAAVSPARITVAASGKRTVSYRATWDLAEVALGCDSYLPHRDCEWLEADFCETDFALLRLSALKEVGSFGEGGYLADADLGFRLRRAGWSLATLPQAQVERSGEIEETTPSSSAHERERFARRYLGYGVSLAGEAYSGGAEAGARLARTLRRHGLVGEKRPELVFTASAKAQGGYLFLPAAATRLSSCWDGAIRRRAAIFSPSASLCRTLADGGFAGARVVPHGIDPDVFSLWGPRESRPPQTRFLWMSESGRRSGLRAMREAWASFRRRGGEGRLLCVGRGLAAAFGLTGGARRLGSLLVGEPGDDVAAIEPLAPLSEEELARLYRACDFVVATSPGQEAGFATIRAMACGVVPILAAPPQDAIEHDPRLVAGAEGPEGLADALLFASAMDEASRAAASRACLRAVRSHWTLRRTAFALHAALAEIQAPAEIGLQAPPPAPPRARPDVPPMVDYAMSLDERQGGAPKTPLLRRMLPSFLRRGGRISPRDFVEFDAEAYLRENPDVAGAGISPLSHFAKAGWLEGRRLSPQLDTRQYLAANAHARHVLLEIQRSRGVAPPAAGRTSVDDRLKPGLLVIGYVEAGLGLGESSRGLVRALAQGTLPFAIYPYNLAVDDRFLGPFMPERYDKAGRYEVTLFEANGDNLDGFLEQFAHRLKGSHAIFRTYWELAEAPRAWADRLARFDEIWAPTRFVAEAFRHVFEGPITVVPPSVSVDSGETFGRARFGLDPDRFLFVFTFDYSSVVARKNPLGLVKAFKAAFPDPRDDVGLVLKSIGAPNLSPATRAALLRVAEEDRRIVILDETLSRDELLSLVRICDCYVSLHCSEGFGFGMAEAMALGRPVIGTDYSGSTDFLDETTGFPVPYRLRPLRDGEYPHGDGQSWAEPDLEAAALILRRVREDRAEREVRAEAGRRRIEERFGAAAVSRIATERLRDLLGRGGG